MTPTPIHQNLRSCRMAAGLTQEAAAQAVGLTRQAISSYERGRTQPDLETLTRLAALYHTDLAALLYGQSETARQRRICRLLERWLLLVPLLLLALHAGILLGCNLLLPVPPGAVTEATRPLLETRFAWLDGRQLPAGLAGLCRWGGSLVLAVYGSTLRPPDPPGQLLRLPLLMLIGLPLVTLPFAAFDPLYRPADYLLPALNLLPPLLLLTLFRLALWLMHTRPIRPAR